MNELKKVILASVSILLVFLLCMGLTFPFELAFTLATGWVPYLIRVLPKAVVSWPGVVSGLVCLAGLTGGLHLFCRWFAGHSGKSWQLRWTLAVLGVVVLMFAAGIAAVGLAHQTSWLVSSPEPLVGPSFAHVFGRMHLSEVGHAFRGYEETHARLPAGVTVDGQGRMLHGWQTELLPFLDEMAVYEKIDRSLPWNHPNNLPHFKKVIVKYQVRGGVPQLDANGMALSHYSGNARVLGGDVPVSLEDLSNGLGVTQTMLVGEAAGDFKPWGQPANWRDPALGINKSPQGFGSRLGKGAHFLFADGHVQWVPDAMAKEILGTPR